MSKLNSYLVVEKVILDRRRYVLMLVWMVELQVRKALPFVESFLVVSQLWVVGFELEDQILMEISNLN